MSILLMTQVWELELPHPHQSVLLAMADHARDDGSRCYPSRARLSYKTNYSIRQVKRIMADLRSTGLIVVVKESTRYEPTHYRIVIEAGQRKPGFDAWWAQHPENRRRSQGGQTVPPDPDDHEGQAVPPATEARGDTTGAPGGTSDPLRGDATVSPESVNRQEPTPPLTPLKGGAASKPVSPIGKRQRDLEAYDRAVRAWAPHPSDADPSLADAWKQITGTVRGQVGDTTFDLWIAPCHLHRAANGQLVVAAPDPTVGWVSDRFGDTIATAAGEPVVFVACPEAA